MTRPRAPRAAAAWRWVGYVALGLGAIGAAVPVLPTVPFLLLAAWAFGKSSPALRERLREDPRFGKALRDWQDRGAVSPATKRRAVAALAASFALLALLWRDPLALALAGVPMAAVAWFLLTRPPPAP